MYIESIIQLLLLIGALLGLLLVAGAIEGVLAKFCQFRQERRLLKMAKKWRNYK